MKVAILHYWFLLNGGGESVVDALLEIFPDADVFCLFADEESIPKGLPRHRLHVSGLAEIPFAKKLNRAVFPFYAACRRQFRFRWIRFGAVVGFALRSRASLRLDRHRSYQLLPYARPVHLGSGAEVYGRIAMVFTKYLR